MQITGQSSVGIANTTFIGNVDGNSQGGAFAVGQGGLVQACYPHCPRSCRALMPVLCMEWAAHMAQSTVSAISM